MIRSDVSHSDAESRDVSHNTSGATRFLGRCDAGSGNIAACQYLGLSGGAPEYLRAEEEVSWQTLGWTHPYQAYDAISLADIEFEQLYFGSNDGDDLSGEFVPDVTLVNGDPKAHCACLGDDPGIYNMWPREVFHFLSTVRTSLYDVE